MHWAFNLDELAEEVFTALEKGQDGNAGHYARFTGSREECIEKAIKILRRVLDDAIYPSDAYGNEDYC